LLALISNFGSVLAIIEPITFTKILISNQGLFSTSSMAQTFISENQWWRLISPIFIHFSFAHLAFNCLWIYILGEKVERIDGTATFLAIIVFTGIFSNFLQYFWTGSKSFWRTIRSNIWIDRILYDLRNRTLNTIDINFRQAYTYS
jgi:GlpG protein